jgi:hypothetical protein
MVTILFFILVSQLFIRWSTLRSWICGMVIHHFVLNFVVLLWKKKIHTSKHACSLQGDLQLGLEVYLVILSCLLDHLRIRFHIYHAGALAHIALTRMGTKGFEIYPMIASYVSIGFRIRLCTVPRHVVVTRTLIGHIVLTHVLALRPVTYSPSPSSMRFVVLHSQERW